MLTLLASQPESLWDEALPVEVLELPADLAQLDGLLEVVPFAVELRGGDPVISERSRA